MGETGSPNVKNYLLFCRRCLLFLLDENPCNHAAGDKNVYFIDGPTLMDLAKNDGTVDGDHPNDLGFYSMANAIMEILRTVL